MIRILLADDQPMVRLGLRVIFEAQDDFAVVGEAGDGEQAIALAHDLEPDVVVMDIRMPRLDGVEATRRLPDRKVLVLTTFDLDEYVVEALRAGASGFLLKDATPAELAHAVRTIAAGDALLSPSVTRRLLDRVLPRVGPALPPAPPALAGLTEREREILLFLAQGMSNGEIADRLVVSGATVKTHVSHVLAKLGLRDRIQAVVLAYEIGLVRPGAGPPPPRQAR